jgi:hypothetical protein
MANLNAYARDARNNIEDVVRNAKYAKNAADKGINENDIETIQNIGYETKKYISDTQKYVDRAKDQLDNLIVAYNNYVIKEVDNVNQLVEQLNQLENQLANYKNKYNENKIILELKEIYEKAGTKEYNAKEAKEHKEKLQNIKKEYANYEEKENVNNFIISKNYFDDEKRELDRANANGVQCERYANNAQYEDHVREGQDLCRYAYDEAYKAEKDGDDALRLYKGNINDLDNKLGNLNKRTRDLKNKIKVDKKIIEKELKKYELLNAKVMLKEEYAKAGTKEYNANKAASLRSEIEKMEKEEQMKKSKIGKIKGFFGF